MALDKLYFITGEVIKLAKLNFLIYKDQNFFFIYHRVVTWV